MVTGFLKDAVISCWPCVNTCVNSSTYNKSMYSQNPKNNTTREVSVIERTCTGCDWEKFDVAKCRLAFFEYTRVSDLMYLVLGKILLDLAISTSSIIS